MKVAPQTVIEETLAERGTRYGQFSNHAEVTQTLKRAMQATPKYDRLSDAHKEALEMIQHKVGRILNGDPNYQDSWHDIQGYARLGEDACFSAIRMEIRS